MQLVSKFVVFDTKMRPFLFVNDIIIKLFLTNFVFA